MQLSETRLRGAVQVVQFVGYPEQVVQVGSHDWHWKVALINVPIGQSQAPVLVFRVAGDVHVRQFVERPAKQVVQPP